MTREEIQNGYVKLLNEVAPLLKGKTLKLSICNAQFTFTPSKECDEHNLLREEDYDKFCEVYAQDNEMGCFFIASNWNDYKEVDPAWLTEHGEEWFERNKVTFKQIKNLVKEMNK